MQDRTLFGQIRRHVRLLRQPASSDDAGAPAHPAMTLSEHVKHEAKALGFAAVGIARVSDDPAREHRERLAAWLDRRMYGTMAWMARDPARRADPRRVLPGC